ncbi:MAG: hypothetical protein L6Q98_08455 [Anaerolineae bacterium]|nr:hypothetical protein [Anaerolineae bacterium]NUQ02620.1 hypothetical protein [Anaerolineae bacterium]
MRGKFPDQVALEPDEVEAINRINVARFYSVTPAQIDAMSEEDYRSSLEIMWYEGQR